MRSARLIALTAAYAYTAGMFTRELIEHLDTLAHHAKPRPR